MVVIDRVLPIASRRAIARSSAQYGLRGTAGRASGSWSCISPDSTTATSDRGTRRPYSPRSCAPPDGPEQMVPRQLHLHAWYEHLDSGDTNSAYTWTSRYRSRRAGRSRGTSVSPPSPATRRGVCAGSQRSPVQKRQDTTKSKIRIARSTEPPAGAGLCEIKKKYGYQPVIRPTTRVKEATELARPTPTRQPGR